MTKEQFQKYFKHEEFYSPEDQARLFDACNKLPFRRELTLWGKQKRHQVVTFTDRFSPRSYGVGPTFRISEAPEEIKEFRSRLSAHVSKSIDYLAIVLYEDGRDYMDWHSHAEDIGYDASVYDLSLGAERFFGVRMKDDFMTAHNGKQVRREPLYFDATPGSLITMCSEANDLCEHCVPKAWRAKTYGRRISINCKAVGPRVFCCRAGEQYPADAVYVGRKVTRGNVSFPDTPFGNHELLETAEMFRDYAELRMVDPEFAAKVESLRGKDLLCWCKGKEVEHCHAKVWLEIANR